jgi:hypothetical protein
VAIIDQSMQILEREKNASVEERYNIANGALFQVTRVMFRTHASLIPKVYNMKRIYFNEALNPGSRENDDDDDDDDDDEEDDDDENDAEQKDAAGDKKSKDDQDNKKPEDEEMAEAQPSTTDNSTKPQPPSVSSPSSILSIAPPSSKSTSASSSSAMLSVPGGDAITEKHVEMEIRVLKEVKKFILEEGL